MENQKIKKYNPLLWIVWLIEGVVVGLGAILPGLSGGTLCAVFGMYQPFIVTLSHLKPKALLENLKKYGLMLGIFVLGAAIGFVGLAGVAEKLMSMNAPLVTCAFVGFIIGTLPEMWKDAGQQKRTKDSFISLGISFIVMLAFLIFVNNYLNLSLSPGFTAYIICGILWGLSFIVPGLSSSTLILYLGLYEQMNAGISGLDTDVLIPMGIGAVACLVLLSKLINFAYDKSYSVVSHCVLGIVAATTIMIMPSFNVSAINIALYISIIVCGAIVSFFFTHLCDKLKRKNEADENHSVSKKAVNA